jgi:ATP-binding protein involved in chromosome partitioning
MLKEVFKCSIKQNKIFGEGGVEKTAKEFNKEFLGKIPLHQDLRIASDEGKPLTFSSPNHEVSLLFKGMAEKISKKFI